MSDGQTDQDLVYMVAGDDERGDHHIFVSTDLDRAEAKRQTMLALFTNVKANWLESDRPTI